MNVCLMKIFIVFFLETTNAIREPTWEDIRDHNVVITTLASARMMWKFYESERLHFTHILIDEAAQALEPECITPLVMADKKTKIVLAGDHRLVITIRIKHGKGLALFVNKNLLARMIFDIKLALSIKNHEY